MNSSRVPKVPATLPQNAVNKAIAVHEGEGEQSLLDGLSCSELFQTTEGLTYK